MHDHRKLRFFVFPVLILAMAVGANLAAGEQEQAQPYEKIRYPTFKDGLLNTLLEANQADVYDLSDGTPRINLTDVVITIYDDSQESRARTPDDEPLPVRMIITSDRGFFTRRPPEPGGQPEEIANLEGNVILRQMQVPAPAAGSPESLKPRKLPPGVETEIHCQHAVWNNTLRKLNGDGEVEFIQEDSNILGNGFLYLADDEAMQTGGGASSIKDWGGIIFIEHNARMEIDRGGRARLGSADGPPANPDHTVITCVDTASYKLRDREIQFERDVKIRRPDLLIESDILKVFLRREDDPQPPRDECGEEGGRNAGEVRSMIATIGKRPGSVVITGLERDPDTGEEKMQYIARGGRADYDFDANRINLTDTRPEMTPRVEFGQDRISDRNLDFSFERDCGAAPGTGTGKSTLKTLNANGGQGRVMLRPREDGGGPAAPTDVSYQGEMNYSRAEGRIRFLDTVYLRQGELTIRSEILDVRMLLDAGGGVTDRLNRIIAENNVTIQAGNREASAQRAEYDIDYATSLDTLRLYGPPQGTPPHPWVRDDQGNQVTAPEIHMQRLAKRSVNDKDRHLLQGFGGVATCDFRTLPDKPGEKSKVISIRSERRMEYNERDQVAYFEGKVVATSDVPEDNYVLTSDRLTVNLVEEPSAIAPGEVEVRLRRIHASGNARLEQDVRICEANEIIRDFPSSDMDEGVIYLEGAAAAPGRPPQMARYWEQTRTAGLGSMFAAPRIMASASGDLIRANGPGQLSMPDDIPGQRSEIHFEGQARYESFHDGMASEAKFRKGVLLRQPSRNFVLNSEELDASFLKDGSEEPREGDDAGIERIGRLRRAEARVAVKVEHAQPHGGKRIAVGDKGIIEFTPTGNVITMSADRSQDKRRFVMARDSDGLTLRAPDIVVREAQGVTMASGPGDLQIPGDSQGEGMSKVPTRVIYGDRGQLVYNELALNIKVNDNVRIVQPGAGNNWQFPSLDGRCDRMEITLFEPPAGGMTNQDALSRVQRMDALGAVLLRVYADPPPDNPNIDWLSRPGTTFFTRGDQGVYYVPEGRIEISSLPGRQPQLLLNMVDEGRPPRRQRLKADRFILNTNTMPRRWTFAGQLDSQNLGDTEPFAFQD